jgi:hypothetical protein
LKSSSLLSSDRDGEQSRLGRPADRGEVHLERMQLILRLSG